MSQALRKITGALNQSKTTAIFINQLREKIGVMFGSPETTTGGRALKFYASVRLDIRRIETLKDGTDAVGNRTRVKVVKNKVAPPFKQAEFDILYGQGISREGGLIDMGVEHGFVRKSGAWYTYEGDQLGQGKENARNFLQGQPRPRQRDREEDPGEAGRRRPAGRGLSRPRQGRRGRRPGGRRRRARPRRQGQDGQGRRCQELAVTRRTEWADPEEPGPRRARSRRGGPDGTGDGTDSSRAEKEPSSQDPAERARAICLRLLTGTPRTRKQLADALKKREIPDEVSEEVLSRFEEVGLINDAAFADAWVESRHHGRGLARRALARELRTKGVDSSVVDEAVAQLDSDQRGGDRPRPGRTQTPLHARPRPRPPAAPPRGHARPQGLPGGHGLEWSARHWSRRANRRRGRPGRPGRPGRAVRTLSRSGPAQLRARWRLCPGKSGRSGPDKGPRRSRGSGAAGRGSGGNRRKRRRRPGPGVTGRPAARHAWKPPIRSVAR